MKIFKAMAILLVLALLFAGCTNLAGAGKSDAKSLVSFKFEAAKNSGVLTADYPATYNDLTGEWEVGPLPAGTNVSALIPTFEVSALASVRIGSTFHSSGVTPNDFANDVVYTVVAEDGSTAAYTIAVKVTVAATGKDITAYALMVGTTLKSATITGTNIALTVPNGTDVTALVATFVLSDPKAVAKVGTTSQVSATTANSFTSAVSYIVTAEDLTTQTYTVTVTVLPPSKLLITEYYEGKVGNNKYLEITNTDSVAVDLSAYNLLAYANGSTTATPALALTGTLAAGKSVVYVNDQYTPATLDTIAAMSSTVSDPNGWKVLVAYTSGATAVSGINFNGNDTMELALGSDTMDFIGNYGDSANWGVDIKMIRKPGKLGNQARIWNAADWYTVPVITTSTTEDDTAGSHTSVYAGSTLDEFWLGGVKGTISGTTITVVVPQGTDLATLVPNFLTTAESVKFSATEQIGGVSVDNLSAIPATTVTVPVAGKQYATTYDVSTTSPASSTTYTVNLVVSDAQNYSTTNYTFDGGIQAVYNFISAGTPGVTYNLDGSGVNTNWSRMYNTYTTSNNGVAVNGAFAINATSIAIDGIDDSLNPIRIGCTIYFGTASTVVYTITATTTTLGKTTGLSLTPALTAAVADNATVTITGYKANFANAALTGATTITQPMLDNIRPIVAGDVFYITGENQSPRHRVTGTTVDGSGNTATITFEPALGSDVTAYTTAAKTYINFVMNQVENSGTNVSLTGIVTAVPSTTSIYIQDQNAAICLYKSSGFPTAKLGDKITISNCRAGSLYNGLAEVTVFGAPAVLSSTAIDPATTTVSTTNTIYVIDSTTWTGIKDLKTRRYHGTMTTGATQVTTSHFTGAFDGSTNNQAFRTTSSGNASKFTVALYPSIMDYYGVIDVYSSTSFMLLLTADQVRTP